MIEFKAVSYRYPDGPVALRNIHLTIESGSFVAVLGKNGAGKTTFVKCINGLVHPDEGQVLVEKIDVARSSVAQMARKVGLVFQNSENQLFSTSVREELAFSLNNIGTPQEQVDKIITRTLDQLNLSDLVNHSPFLLSGGQKKRVAFASLACMDPGIFIADEPTQGQDEIQRNNIERILDDMRQSGKTVIVVTHDLDLVLRLATRVLIFHDGEISFDGTVEEVFRSRHVLEQEGLVATQGLEIKWLLQRYAPRKPGILGLDEDALIDFFMETLTEVRSGVD